MYSGLVGIIGGLIDLIAGVALLQPAAMMGGETWMGIPPSVWTGYFLIALGIAVLSTGVYLLLRLMMNRSFFGLLMLIYGVIMFVLGTGMLARVFSMMQNSTISGIAMLITGTAMLYSGFRMTRM